MRPISVVSIVCLLLFASCAWGASVTMDSSCYTDLPGGGSIMTTSMTSANIPASVLATGGCSVGSNTLPVPPTQPFAEAQGEIDYGVLFGEFIAQGSVEARGYQIPEPFVQRFSNAAVSLAFDLVASSAGPPRPGQILVDSLELIFPDPGGSSASFECQIGSLLAAFSMCPGGLFPFMLGESFGIHIGAFADASGDVLFGPADRVAEFRLSFRLFEVDGAPVDLQLFPVPEPSTLLLLASALPVLVLRKAVRKKR